ncbi:MAG: hypothetical protein ACK4QL_03500 [Pseudanabaenaceae cyanobacterium]
MAPVNTIELARQGDANAIAALMNKSLRPKGVIAEATRKGNNLEVRLHSERPLNQKTMVEIIQRGMKNLQVTSIAKVLVQSANWKSEIFLQELPPEKVVAQNTNTNIPDISRSIQSGQNRQVKVSSPVILMPKLSQVQMSLQQYQDTIIRLTDDTGKKILCLCTLAELIQALHHSNPELEHISQTLEKCSQTNSDGEKIIRNVSVLQPGQDWQSVKIRCVLQICFELDTAIELTDKTPAEEETVIDTAQDTTQDTVIEPPATPASDDTVVEPLEAGAHEDTVIEVAAPPISASDSDDTIVEVVQAPPTQPEALRGRVEDPSAHPEVEPLFQEFNFTMTYPAQTLQELETLGDPTVPPPPQPSANLTLEEFCSEILSAV